ncbi:MAG: enoyl-CoA hydratase-related protein [Desulfobacterales bacterium]
MAYTELIYTVEDMVATITLNRPERMNALTGTTYREAAEAIGEADADNDVRSVVITGAGRGFCSGDDVKELPGAPSPEQLAQRKIPSKAGPTPLAEALLSFDKPLIAAVNGAAIGWGMDLALMCDIRIASENAKFGEVYVRRGLVADIAGWLLLPRIVGLSKAYEILLTGDIIDAQEAERIGLVTKTVPHDDLMPVVNAMAAKMAGMPPVAVRMTKEAVRKGLDYNLPALGEYHSYALKVLFGTEDFREGSTAVLEKRTPTFKGR